MTLYSYLLFIGLEPATLRMKRLIVLGAQPLRYRPAGRNLVLQIGPHIYMLAKSQITIIWDLSVPKSQIYPKLISQKLY